MFLPLNKSHQYGLFIILSFAVATTAACSREEDSESGICDDGSTFDFDLKDSETVFDDNLLETYEITMDPAVWNQLQADPLAEQYVEAGLKVAGCNIGTVGLRFKGSIGSLQSCFNSGANACTKLSMKIKFSEFNPEKRFHGLKRLNFHSMVNDTSMLKDRLGYSLFQKMGIHGPRATHARLVINGEYRGLFALIEQVDGRFTDNRFEDAQNNGGDGDLYKQGWPNSNDPEAYVDAIKTNEETATHEKIIRFHNSLISATEAELPTVLEHWIDIDYWLRAIAVDRAIANWDGALGMYFAPGWPNYGNDNFYLYSQEEGDRFWFIPWDLDFTFSMATPFRHVPSWNSDPVDCVTPELYLVSFGSTVMHSGCDPLLRGLALAGRQNDRYGSAIQQLLDGPFQLSAMNAQIDKWAAQIEHAVETDSNGPGVAVWRQSVEELRYDLTTLRENLQNIRDELTTEPWTISPHQKVDFEQMDAVSFKKGAIEDNNQNSFSHVTLNMQSPIEGAKDCRLDFYIRNQFDDPERGAWQQYAGLHLEFFNADHINLLEQGIAGLSLSLKSNAPRVVRIVFNSDVYPEGVWGRFGVSLDVTEQVNTFTINLAELDFPEWDNPGGVTLNHVLERTFGMSIIIEEPLGIGANGVFAADGGDQGFFQMDNFQFF